MAEYRTTDDMKKPKKVWYKGTQYFVGEAKTALFFDSIGIPYIKEYQRYDVGHGMLYTPDFFLPEHNIFVEVKNRPWGTLEGYEIEKMRYFVENCKKRLYIMRKPTMSPSFIEFDFVESNQRMYSDIYIHGDPYKPSMLVFGADGGLVQHHLGDPIPNSEIINRVENTDFMPVDETRYTLDMYGNPVGDASGWC